MADEPVTQDRSQVLGALLRKARIQAGQSRLNCANILGVSTQTITDFESGTAAIAVTQLETLAGFLGVPVSYFFTAEDRAEGIPETETTEPQDIAQERMWLRSKIIGIQVRQARLEAGKTQKECAERLSVSPRYVSEYEHGRRDIPLIELETLADFLGVPLRDFIECETDPNKPTANRRKVVSGRLAPGQAGGPSVSIEEIEHLTPEMQDFIAKPVNSLYLHLAFKLSDLPADVLREIGESLLEITY
jgi:transcriptional regulator with XRE-family HTH domain